MCHRLQEQGVAKDASWQSIMARDRFAQASDDGSGTLSHLTDLYVERHHSLWKVLRCFSTFRLFC